jgi:hypothetical protein
MICYGTLGLLGPLLLLQFTPTIPRSPKRDRWIPACIAGVTRMLE